MKYHLVTTVNAKGWEQSGRKMAESFASRWEAGLFPLTIYAEGFEPEENPAWTVRLLPEWVDAFKAEHAGDPTRAGRYGNRYDYRFDAVKFVHKVGAVTDFGAGLDDGTMIWIDADTFTHADVTEDWLNGLFPGDGYLAWLDRKDAHPECGFVMFRCGHLYHQAFMASFRRLYESGEVFKLRETHDSYVLQWLALSKAGKGKIPHPHSLSGVGRNASHVLANSPLSACLDHMKGDRKTIGRTPKRERFLIRDNNPYWR